MGSEEEFKRLLDLSELEPDFSNLDKYLGDLTKIAAKVSGNDVSLINLIDNHTQWSVSSFGMDIVQMPREEAVCNYTIKGEVDLEIADLSNDERFKELNYVKKDPRLKYYYGVPLKTDNGNNIGALCVLDPEEKYLAPEKKEILKMLANEVVSRLKFLKHMKDMQDSVENLEETKQKLSHDLRGPINGIIGLADLIEMEGKESKIEDILELASLIKKGGHSVIDLVEEILNQSVQNDSAKNKADEVTCDQFCKNLEELYNPQALSKNIDLTIQTDSKTENLQFSKAKALQIAGNLISNSIKFTKEGGVINVDVSVIKNDTSTSQLEIRVKDNGVGMSKDEISSILEQKNKTFKGTGGEEGYGFGLSFVQHLVTEHEGTIEVESEEKEGTTFTIKLPL